MLKKTFVILLLSLFCFQNCEPKKENDLVPVLALLALSSMCNVGNGAFYIPDFYGEGSKCVRVNKVAEGNRIILYEEEGLSSLRRSYNISAPGYSTMLSELENRMIPRITDAIGSPTDINKDGKVAIVFADLNPYTTSGSYIGGFVNPGDFFQNGEITSNEREILFIDGFLLFYYSSLNTNKGKPSDIYSTIAHEYQHMVRFPFEVNKGNIQAPIPYPTTYYEAMELSRSDSLWINEGTSEVISDVAGYGPQGARLACLRSDPSYGCSNVLNGKSLFNFIGRISDYSLSYAWMSFIYENSGNSLATKNNFLRASVRGSGSNRANTASNLSFLYNNTAEKYSSTINNVTGGSFATMQSAFLANFFGYPNTATTTGRYNSGVETNLSSAGGGIGLVSTYTLPTSLAELTTKPSLMIPVNNTPTSFDLEPGQTFRVTGTAPALVGKTGLALVKNGTTEYFVFNTSTVETGTFGFINVSTSIKDINGSERIITRPVWSVEKISEVAPIGGTHFLRERDAYLRQKRFLNE